MCQLVLTVRGAIFQTTELFDDLRVEPMNACLVDGFFAGFKDVFVHLLALFFKDLLDVGGMNATVVHQAGQRSARDLAADRIETRDSHGFGRIVHDHIDTGHLFKCADVAPVATNDATFHFFVRQGDQSGCDLGDLVGSDPLDGIRDQFACFSIPVSRASVSI